MVSLREKDKQSSHHGSLGKMGKRLDMPVPSNPAKLSIAHGISTLAATMAHTKLFCLLPWKEALINRT